MIELNNPMNIRISPVAWRNKDKPSRNEQFETFPTPADGLHAGFLNVLHAQTLHGCHTISEIINRLSPPSENNTADYVCHVCDECGADPDETYNLMLPENLLMLGKAIIQQENGKQPYTDDQLRDAVDGVLI